MSERVSLRHLVSEVVETSPDADPGQIAAQVVDRLPRADYKHALLELARPYVREVIRTSRSQHSKRMGARGSSKVAAIREAAWKARLDSPEYVPSADVWIHLRDATREQVLEMAAYRIKLGTESIIAGKRYEALAEDMRKASVMRVGDMAEDMLREALTRDAAALNAA
jgi:hypothetical protein